MKKHLIPILSVALSLAAGSVVSAQGPEEGGPGPHHHGRPNLTEMLNHTLQFTDAQKAQVQPLVDAAQPKLKEIHEQARAQADVVLKQLDAQIRPLLDPQQQKKLDALETLRDSRLPGSPE
jgi:Spy/CpxP family protein refolding chaperone